MDVAAGIAELIDDRRGPAAQFQHVRAIGQRISKTGAKPGPVVNMVRGGAEIEAIRSIAPIDPDDGNPLRSDRQAAPAVSVAIAARAGETSTPIVPSQPSG